MDIRGKEEDIRMISGGRDVGRGKGRIDEEEREKDRWRRRERCK